MGGFVLIIVGFYTNLKTEKKEMSRSYKHIACYTDHNASTWRRKRWASKAIRRKILELMDGSMYKKMYETWSICDFRFRIEFNIPSHWSSEDLAKARRK